MSFVPLVAFLLLASPPSTPGATPPGMPQEPVLRELPAAPVPFELPVLLERARVAASARKPRDRVLKSQIERLRSRAELASPRPDEERGTHDFGESNVPLLVIEGDARVFVAKEGALRVSRVLDGVLVVDGDVEVGFARDAVIVATGAVSVAHVYDSVIVGGVSVRVSYDRGGVLVSGGTIDVSHAEDTVLAGRDLRVSGVKQNLTCVNAETVALSCDRVRDPSIDLGPPAPLPGVLASRVSITEARGDAPSRAWITVDGGPELDVAPGDDVPGLDGWKLALAKYDFVLFRKGDEVSGWRFEPRERKRLFVGTADGEVHVLDRATLGKRERWTFGGKKRAGKVWLFFAGTGRAFAVSERGRALRVSEGSHPVEAKVGETIRQASLIGSSLVLHGQKNIHLMPGPDSGSPEPKTMALAGATNDGTPPSAAWISRGGRLFIADGSEVVRPEFGQKPGGVRRDLGAEIHALLVRPDESAVLAIVGGDDATSPRVVELAPDTLEIRRTLHLPKPGRVHDAALSGDATRLVLALGDRVECVHLASGEVIWERPAPGGGHVRVLDGGRVALVGHASSELRVVEIERGETETTTPLGLGSAPELGHAIAWDSWTREVALLDVAGRRVLLVKDGAVHATERFGSTPTSVVFVHR